MCLCDQLPGRLSHFLESARLYLADAFAGDAKFQREVFQRHWFVSQIPCLEDAAFAVVEYTDCSGQRLLPILFLVLFADDGFRRGGPINEEAPPFVAFAGVLDRRIERRIGTEAPVRVNYILLRDI